MKFLCLSFLAGILTLPAIAHDITGTWTAVFLAPMGERPKMVSKIVFDLRADGDKLIGMVHAGNWPGDAVITDGKIDGERFSFSVVGSSPWSSSGGSDGPLSGYPKLEFAGILREQKMNVTLTWSSVMIQGNPRNTGRQYEMAATRTSD